MSCPVGRQFAQLKMVALTNGHRAKRRCLPTTDPAHRGSL